MGVPSYPLVTERLQLRPFVPTDLDALHAMQRREDVTRYLYWGPRSRTETRRLLDRVIPLIAIDDSSDAVRLAVVLTETGQVIGDFSLQRVSAEHRQGEIGFVLDPRHQGRGYATEAASEMLRLGFEAIGFHRIVGRCDARNAPSAQLMERLGMRREAHFRQNEFVKGEWCDELVFALLSSEWELRPPPAGR
ncbi:MAG: GNAT family N-acetyltransferase [Chloroflexota bacterium]|nr:GNAT family N-acetyltransferase [Chloroflexota bacterium]